MKVVIGIVAIVLMVAVYRDAKKIGLKPNTLPGWLRYGPTGWAVLCLLLNVIAIPAYALVARPKYIAAIRATPEGAVLPDPSKWFPMLVGIGAAVLFLMSTGSGARNAPKTPTGQSAGHVAASSNKEVRYNSWGEKASLRMLTICAVAAVTSGYSPEETTKICSCVNGQLSARFTEQDVLAYAANAKAPSNNISTDSIDRAVNMCGLQQRAAELSAAKRLDYCASALQALVRMQRRPVGKEVAWLKLVAGPFGDCLAEFGYHSDAGVICASRGLGDPFMDACIADR